MTGSLWNYYRDEVNDNTNEKNQPEDFRINNNKTTTGKYFEYKEKNSRRHISSY